MAISKLLQATLKILSTPDVHLKKNYKKIRVLQNLTAPTNKNEQIIKKDCGLKTNEQAIPIRLYVKKGTREKALIIFYHGGGWVIGNVNTYDNVCTALALETGNIVIAIDYRLAPEFPFPNGLQDCYQVTKEIFDHLDELQLKREDITLMGDSAGGNIASVISLMARDKQEFYPYQQILCYPITDTDHSKSAPYPSVHENGDSYLLTTKRINDYLDLYLDNIHDKTNPYVAPILANNFQNQPRTLVLTAEFDPLRDEGELYGKRLQEAGGDVKIVRIKDSIHGFLSTKNKNIQEQAYQEITQFIKEGQHVSKK